MAYFQKTKSLVANKEIKPSYFNSIAVRATTNQNNLQGINPSNISLFLGPNLHSVVYPVNKSGLFNFVCILRMTLSNEELDNYSLFDSSAFISSISTKNIKTSRPKYYKKFKRY